MENILIIGSSGHSKVIIDIVEKQGLYNIVGLIDSFKAAGEKTLDYQVIGTESDISMLASKYSVAGLIVAIGDNNSRAKVFENISENHPNLPFVRAIHPTASIGKGVTIGDGTAVMAGAVINSSCVIGQSCIVNTGASLDHDSIMEDYASLAPGVTTGGNCRIGTYSAVSLGANLRHGITIGKQTVIGAGSMVLKSVPDFTVAYGNPARIIRSRSQGDKYL